MSISAAEAEISPFIEKGNTPNALLVSPEAAEAAGTSFTALCDDELLANAGFVDTSEYPEGYPRALLQKEKFFSDGSNIKVSVSSGAQRLPEDHPEKKFALDHLYGIKVHSWSGEGSDVRMEVSDYKFDEKTATVRKKVTDPMADIKRLLSIAETVELQALSKGDLETVEDAVENALFADMENEIAGQELEKAIGLDESILVGPEEIEELRILIAGAEPVKTVKAHKSS